MGEELTRNKETEEQQEESGSEERGAALPEGRAGGRRGETARLERKTGQTRLDTLEAESLTAAGESNPTATGGEFHARIG